MKYIFTVISFLINQATINGQNPGSSSNLLAPLDLSIANCGRVEFGLQEKCKLTVTNNTELPIQGYWVNWYGQASKVRFAQLDPNSSKTISVFTNEYWVFTDANLNIAGIYEPIFETNEIVINPSDLKNTRRLSRAITDRNIPGTVSGGDWLKEQVNYDILKYDLSLEVFPDQKFIKGSNTITIEGLDDLEYFVFDLDSMLEIEQVSLLDNGVLFPLTTLTHHEKHWSKFPLRVNKGKIVNIVVEYGGYPREATHAPYKGGFSWNKTATCEHWIATSCQVDGADLWFPCKDYQWDEPDSVDLAFTVPKGLKAISNGILVDSIDNNNGTTTFQWKVFGPINTYDIALNIAPYKYIPDEFVSAGGDSLKLGYWVLPENFNKAKEFYPYSKKYLHFLESHLGPYPFRKEKLGIAEVPFVAMEHQTIIAMGPKYELKYPAYNSILFHEICHEWFGNMVTALDWKDFWIQESLAGYMEALYEEELMGQKGYKMKIESFSNGLENKNALAPVSIVNSREIYSGDSYKKGAFLLHTLRYLIGKEKILKVLRLMAYPDISLEHAADGSQCRFTTTDEFFKTLEDVSHQNFDWFEEVYFRSAELPKLEIEENKHGLRFKWVTINNTEFNMPLELETSEGIVTVDFVNNFSKCKLSRNEINRIDPNGWILFDLEESTRDNKR